LIFQKTFYFIQLKHLRKLGSNISITMEEYKTNIEENQKNRLLYGSLTDALQSAIFAAGGGFILIVGSALLKIVIWPSLFIASAIILLVIIRTFRSAHDPSDIQQYTFGKDAIKVSNDTDEPSLDYKDVWGMEDTKDIFARMLGLDVIVLRKRPRKSSETSVEQIIPRKQITPFVSISKTRRKILGRIDNHGRTRIFVNRGEFKELEKRYTAFLEIPRERDENEIVQERVSKRKAALSIIIPLTIIIAIILFLNYIDFDPLR